MTDLLLVLTPALSILGFFGAFVLRMEWLRRRARRQADEESWLQRGYSKEFYRKHIRR